VFASKTTSEVQSLRSPVVKWRSFAPVERKEVMSKDLTSQRSPLKLNVPDGVESPSKMCPAGTSVFPFRTSASSSKVWPSETTKSRLALPPPGYGTPVTVSSQPAGS
jgi:hypothetical protein